MNFKKNDEILQRIEELKETLATRERLDDGDRRMILKEFVKIVLAEGNTIQTDSAQRTEQHSRLNLEAPFSELVRKAKFKKHPDLVLLATYDLMVNKDKESVITSEIQEQYKMGLIKPSKNISSDIRQNIKKGYMMRAGKRDGKLTSRITLTGIDYIEGSLKNGE